MKTKSATGQIGGVVILSTFMFLGALIIAPLVNAAIIFNDNFEDGDHTDWLETATGNLLGSTGVETHNDSLMAFAQDTGSGSYSLSHDFSYVSNQIVSFAMQAIANSRPLSGDSVLHANSGVTISFLDIFNSTLGSVLITNATDPDSLGQNSILVDTAQHDYSASMAEFAAQAGLGTTDSISKINLNFFASAETFGNVSGVAHSSSTVWFDNVTISDTPVDSPVDLAGTIKTEEGFDVCAMVLASGQFMFSCNPLGVLSLNNLARQQDGTVKRQIYADGFFPKIDILNDSTNETVVLTRSGVCPSYNLLNDPAVVPGSAGKRIDISGKVLMQDSQSPVCAMVLANGQNMFSCNGLGSYSLNIPLDFNGQFKLQVYADGFAPTIQTFDEFTAVNDVRMARAIECQ